MPALHFPTIAPPLGRRHVSRRFLVLTWLVTLVVAVSVFGSWMVFGTKGSAQAPVMHIGPPAGAAGVTTTRTTFRDLTDPEHPRTWTLERSYRARAIDVPATVERR